MLKKKKKRGRPPINDGPVSISCPPPQSDIEEKSPEYDRESAPEAGNMVLLASLPQSLWLNRRVRLLTGPNSGKVGTTFKVHYGWIHINIDNIDSDLREESCRRALDLELVQPTESEKASIGAYSALLLGDSDKNSTEETCEEEELENDLQDASTIKEVLLSTIPVQRWPGMLVKVKYGGLTGQFARVLRINNGWVHLSSDLVTDYSLIDNYDACRRAFELQVVEKGPSTSEGEICVAQTLERSRAEEVCSADDDIYSMSPLQSNKFSTRHGNFRSSISPVSGRASLGLGIGENPYANKKIMVGSNYQVSNSSLPPINTTRTMCDVDRGNERLDRLVRNCVWSQKNETNNEEIEKFLSAFNAAESDWIRSLFMKGRRTGVEDVFTYVRCEILKSRVGHLQLKDPNHKFDEKNKHVPVSYSTRPTCKRMLQTNHKFHKMVKKAKSDIKKYASTSLSDMIMKVHKTSTDQMMHEVLEKSDKVNLF